MVNFGVFANEVVVDNGCVRADGMSARLLSGSVVVNRGIVVYGVGDAEGGVAFYQCANDGRVTLNGLGVVVIPCQKII